MCSVSSILLIQHIIFNFALLLVWIHNCILCDRANARTTEHSNFYCYRDEQICTILVPIFGSKLYIVLLFKPKKNTTEGSRHDVRTTTDIKSVPGTVMRLMVMELLLSLACEGTLQCMCDFLKSNLYCCIPVNYTSFWVLFLTLFTVPSLQIKKKNKKKQQQQQQ